MSSGNDDGTIRAAYEQLVGGMKMGKSPEASAADLLMLGLSRDIVELALERVRQRAEEARVLRIPEALVDREGLPSAWYQGPSPGDRCWPALEQDLRRRGLKATAVESIESASTKIVGLLAPPWENPIRTRGLVLGYVQSGKTSNFTAVTAKAADAGYRLFIVLSGMHNNLRRQTQTRLDEQLVELNKDLWLPLTSDTADFGRAPNPDALLTISDRRFLCVVKKNASRMRRLVSWLSGADNATLESCPILVIDDEADQASVNTAAEEEERTAINRCLVELLGLPKVAYVGYTATPFANLFVDPGVPPDVYPRDFIVDLPRPSDYFGPERVFGRQPLEHDQEYDDDGLDMIRRIDPMELQALQPATRRAARAKFEADITPSLEEAFRYFILATAARRTRGQHEHSTMLMHTTLYTDVHELYQEPIRELARSLRDRVAAGDRPTLDQLQLQWEDETAAVSAIELDETPVSFEALRDHLIGVLDSLEVVIDNYRSTDRLHYSDEPKVVLVIGGNTLSRGLTLEGLVVSFFIRTARTYDTLLQMGRWFGYRRGYQDLPRIWMTDELEEWFRFLATVEAEIRVDVSRYEREGVTPLSYATRIRTHPQLAITSALKMRHAVPAQVSYAGRRLQTILFDHRDQDWLRVNIDAARALVSRARERIGEPQDLGRGRWLFAGLDVASVTAFLGEYSFHRNAVELQRNLILRYIEDQNRYEDLVKWNVVVMSRAKSPLGTMDLGLSVPIGLINRARLHSNRPYADIKSLMSRVDRVVDLDLSPEEVRGDDDELQALRPFGTGLLLLYPVAKDSQPIRGERRVPLDAVDDVVGVGMVFPNVPPGRAWTAVDYMAVELPETFATEDEDAEIDEFEDVEGDYEAPEA